MKNKPNERCDECKQAKGERVTAVWDFTNCPPEPDAWSYVRRRNQQVERAANEKQINHNNKTK